MIQRALHLVAGLLLLGMLSTGMGCAGFCNREESPRDGVEASSESRHDVETAKRANQEGLAFLDKSELDNAAQAFRKALNADVDFGPAHNNLGKVYYLQQKWYDAAWEFENARNLLPKHAEPCNNIALVLERGGDLDRAVDSYREAVRLDPANIEYRANLARALIRRGDRTDEIRRLLRMLVECDPRPQWRDWARLQQAVTGAMPD